MKRRSTFFTEYPKAMRWTALVAIALALTSAGCGVFGGGAQSGLQDQIRQRIQDKRAQWRSQEIDDYRLVYEQSIGDRVVDSIEVFVRGREVDSTHTSRSSGEVDRLVGTVASFFTLVEARVGEEASQFSVEFDDESGYPIEYEASFSDDRRNHAVFTISLEATGAGD